MIAAWNRFFYKPTDPRPIALYRILLAALLLIKTLFLWSDLLVWFGEGGVLPMNTLHIVQNGLRLNLFAFLPQSDAVIKFVFILFSLACFCLMVGLFTRTSLFLVFIGLVSLHHRNPFILTGAETVMRVTCFLLIFSACGKAWSLDRFWKVEQGKISGSQIVCSPWAQRLIQIQICVIYATSLWWKLKGHTWIDGTAVGVAHQFLAFQRYSLPYVFDHLWSVKIMTWGTLIVEFSLAFLVWVKPIRFYVLAAGVLLHLGLEYSMTIPLFEWIMIASFVCFIEFPPPITNRQ